MKKPYRFAILLCVVSLAACQEEADQSGADSSDKVLVSMRGNQITETDFTDEINKISPFAKSQFSGSEGKRRMLDRMVQNEILYLAAREKGYQKSPEVQQQLEDYERNLLIREYYKSEIQDRLVIDEPAVQRYYEKNVEKYTEKARVKVRHILAATEEAATSLRNELEDGADFNTLAREKSEDKLSSRRDGLLGNIIENGYIPTIGKDEDIQVKLFAMEEGEISDPIKSRKGFHLFLIETKTPSRQKEIAEVEDLIKGELKRDLLKEAMDQRIEDLKEHYAVEFIDANIESAEDPATTEFEFNLEEPADPAEPPEQPAAEPKSHSDADQPSEVKQLLAEAAELKDPQASIRAYKEILQQHPQDDEVYKARFMIGFIYSEQLGDRDRAAAEYHQVLSDYPNCDLTESARFMLQELGGEDTSFAGNPAQEVAA